ncbi:MAG: J domain-containing protein [Acidimicrobiales bacterium]
MAPRFPRRRRDADDHPEPERDPDNADLNAEEHAWWAQRDLSKPLAIPPTVDAGASPPRDVLADHLGEDWRSHFGLDAPGPVSTEPASPEPPSEPDAPWVPFDFDAAARPATPSPEPDHEPEPEPQQDIDASDPYAVLGVDHSATWEEIVTAHRSQARRHHPDRMFGRSETEVQRAEGRIRDLNVAYQELRIRRGK